MASEDIALLEKQNKMLYNQLITLSNSQIDDAQEALTIIANAQNEISVIKENFKLINEKMKENQVMISDYGLIKKVQNTLTNVSMAREWLARVLRLMKEVKELRKILKFEKTYFEEEEEEEEGDEDAENEEDDEDEESEESSDEEFDVAAYDLDEILEYEEENEDSMLPEVYERINELETFRQTVFAESEESPEFLDIFSMHLSVIDEVSEEFVHVMDKYFESIVELAEEDPVRLLNVIKIVENEEKEQNEAEERAKANPTRISIKKITKNLRARCFECIDNYVEKYFQENFAECDSLKAKLEQISDLWDGDLEHIERNVVPCFPEEYNILERYIKGYEKQTREFLNKQIHDKISNSDRVTIITWIEDTKEIFADYKQYLEVKDFSDELTQLKGDYLSDFSSKLHEWSEKIVEHSIKPDAKLQEDEGCVYTYGPIDFFTFLNQTISTVCATQQHELIEKIAFIIRNTLSTFNEQIVNNILSKIDVFSLEKICAHVNDCSRCIQFTKEIEEVLSEILPEADKEFFEMDEVINGCNDVSKRILAALAERSYARLAHYFDDQFGKLWYDKKKVSIIQLAVRVLTKEFEESYLEYLEYDFIGIIAEKILNKLIKRYLDGWIMKDFVLKNEEMDIVIAEIAAFKKFCGNEPWSSEVLKPLDFLERFLSITDKEDVTVAIGDALSSNNFPDMPMSIPEVIIKKCGKYKKKEQEELIEAIKKFYEGWKELNQDTKGHKKTIFSQYAVHDKGKKSFFKRAARQQQQIEKSQTHGLS